MDEVDLPPWSPAADPSAIGDLQNGTQVLHTNSPISPVAGVADLTFVAFTTASAKHNNLNNPDNPNYAVENVHSPFRKRVNRGATRVSFSPDTDDNNINNGNHNSSQTSRPGELDLNYE